MESIRGCDRYLRVTMESNGAVSGTYESLWNLLGAVTGTYESLWNLMGAVSGYNEFIIYSSVLTQQTHMF